MSVKTYTDTGAYHPFTRPSRESCGCHSVLVNYRTNGDGTTPTTSCSGSNAASDGSSALSRQVESGSGTEASGKC